MRYQLIFKKFITSQHLSTGINVTVAVVISGIILYNYNLLSIATGIPLGAMFVSLSDSAGPPKHRTNGMIAAILLNSLMVLIASASYQYPILAAIEIAVFGLVLSMGGIFGNRATNIGVLALIAFIIAGSHVGQNPWQQALFYLIGGTWYGLFSLTSYKLRPYKAAEQLTGESLIEISNYLYTKGELYSKHANRDVIYPKLLQHQVTIQTLQNDIRELMFKTRAFVKESTDRSRRLMMIFLDSIDLFEQIMTSQQNYRQLHKDFDDTEILEQYHTNIKSIAHTLHLMGLAVQAGEYKNVNYHYHEEVVKSKALFLQLRKEKLQPNTIEPFIRLRHILFNLEKLSERLDRIAVYLNKKEKIKNTTATHAPQFITHQEFNTSLFFSNITLKSATFRHAIRVSLGLIIGYIISLFFTIGHSYWILLTVVSIMKPAYGVSRKRNLQRIGGTLTGGVIGFGMLYITQSHSIIFVTMLLSMALAYTFLRIQYFVSSAFITLYVLLSLYFLQGANASVITDRVIDTVIGGVIAFICGYFIFPNWEKEKINEILHDAIKANKYYFGKATEYFTGKPPALLDYKLARKEAFLNLANLSDALQRMMSEPKHRQHAAKDYHQFAVTHHILTSYIASIAYYANQFTNKYDGIDFIPMVNIINQQFNNLLEADNANIDSDNTSKFPFNKRVEKLLEQRRYELQSGAATSVINKTLSEIKSITDQFMLIHAVLNDEIKIFNRINRSL